MRKIISYIFVLLIVLSIFGYTAPSVKAYSNNSLIDDAVFDNATTMDTASIQNFLNQYPNSCLKNYSAAYPNSYFSYGGAVSAATVIRRVADLWGINPQVILTKLEQEESLVRGNAGCPDWRYNSAMGMGCPDGGACPAPQYAGFSQQVTKGSWQLKWSKEAAIGNVNWQDNGDLTYGGKMTQGNRKRCNACQTVYYDGYYTMDGVLTHMDNGATASLYTYTPHVPSSFPVLFETFFGAGSTSATYNNVATNAVGQTLVSGGVLRPGDYLISSSGNAVFTLQADGNLVLYRNGVAVWYSGTNGRPATGVEMQSDGNLVITFIYGDKWSTSTAGNPGATLKLQTDGNLVIYTSDNRAIWNSGTWLSPTQLLQSNSTLTTGVIYRGQQLYSPNGKYRAILQNDGNFVLYSPNRALWSSTTWNTSVKSLFMQNDGNLVLYNENRQALWHTNTWRRGVSRLVMQNDGNLVIYTNAGTPTWYTNTVGQL